MFQISEEILDLRLDRFRDGTNLIDLNPKGHHVRMFPSAYSHTSSAYLQQKAVGALLLDSGLDSEWVGDSQIVGDALDFAALEEVGPCLPIVLVERILDENDWVLLDEAHVEVGEFLGGEPF